jgi:hypothetical protein
MNATEDHCVAALLCLVSHLLLLLLQLVSATIHVSATLSAEAYQAVQWTTRIYDAYLQNK